MNPTARTRRLQPTWGRALLGAALFLTLAPRTAFPAAPLLGIVERGTGAQTLVLIPGLGQDRAIWDRVAGRLEERFRIVIVELPGHGASGSIPKVSVTAVADAVDRALKSRKVKGAILVGHSYGGLVALEEAASHADRAAGVISIDIATYAAFDSERVANLEEVMKDRYPIFVHSVFGPMTIDPGESDSLIAMASRVPRDVLTEYFRDVWSEDLRPRIRNLKAPILFVATEATWRPAESWTSARKRLGYETAGPAIGRRILDSGHMIQIDQPDSLAFAIAEFAETLKK